MPALTLTFQTITAGAYGTFGNGMAKGTTNYYPAVSFLKADESGLYDLFPTPVAAIRSAALESNHVFKSSAGNLLDAYCLATIAGFFMLFDATSAPADGAVTPLGVIPVAGGQATSFSYPSGSPLSFATGLVGVFSTTGPFTKTASSTAFLSARIQ